jgi:hypothetical protein
VSLILYAFLAARLEDILASLYLTPAMSGALDGAADPAFPAIVFVVQLALGGRRFPVAGGLPHRQRNRMSRKEMMDEFKESEGDPHLKSARRQRAQEVATNRMLTDVATANVVVVNPTHYAVALRWDRSQGRRAGLRRQGRGRDRRARSANALPNTACRSTAIRPPPGPFMPRSRSARRSGSNTTAPSLPRSALPRRCAKGAPAMSKASDMVRLADLGAADAGSPFGTAAPACRRAGEQPDADRRAGTSLAVPRTWIR